jgi:hypothetical protein
VVCVAGPRRSPGYLFRAGQAAPPINGRRPAADHGMRWQVLGIQFLILSPLELLKAPPHSAAAAGVIALVWANRSTC